MATVDELVDESLQELKLSPEEIKELPKHEAQEVFEKAKAKFVEGNPRVWWLRLKKKPFSVDVEEASEFHYLRHHWPPNEDRCYFIPENESNIPRVFYATLLGVIKILGNSPFFEYYLVGKNFDWLMIENDHNELLKVEDVV